MFLGVLDFAVVEVKELGEDGAEDEVCGGRSLLARIGDLTVGRGGEDLDWICRTV